MKHLLIHWNGAICVPSLQSTEYKGEYWKDHPTIKLFWEVFHSLPLQKKKQFLCKCPLFMKKIKEIGLLSAKRSL